MMVIVDVINFRQSSFRWMPTMVLVCLLSIQCDSEHGAHQTNVISNLHLGLPFDSVIALTKVAGWTGDTSSNQKGHLLFFKIDYVPKIKTPFSAMLVFGGDTLISFQFMPSISSGRSPKPTFSDYHELVSDVTKILGSPTMSSNGDNTNMTAWGNLRTGHILNDPIYVVKLNTVSGLTYVASMPGR